MDNRAYWHNRTTQRILRGEKDAVPILRSVERIYQEATKQLEQQLQSIYKNYGKKVGTQTVLDPKDFEKKVNKLELKQFKKIIYKKAKKLGLDPSKVYDERYFYRAKRIKLLQEQLHLTIMDIARRFDILSTAGFRQIIQQHYNRAQKDYKKHLKIEPTFNTLEEDGLDAILSAKWQGSNYSNRIWDNTQRLALEARSLLGGAVLSGQSYAKTARQLRDRMGVGTADALRLVRTESNYFMNQAEQQSMIDDGFEFYRYLAVLDNRTSHICRSLNGKVFRLDEAQAGENYPPMHPNCRSTVTVAFDKHGNLVKAKKIPTQTQRFARLDPIAEDGFSKWQRQMYKVHPKALQRDYVSKINEYLNLQSRFGKYDKITQLIRTIPKDHPYRDSVIQYAKKHGWRGDPADRLKQAFSVDEQKHIITDKQYKQFLKNIDKIDFSDATEVMARTAEFIRKNPKWRIRFRPMYVEGLSGTVGYDTQAKKPMLDLQIFIPTTKKFDAKFKFRTIAHELGHVFDRTNGLRTYDFLNDKKALTNQKLWREYVDTARKQDIVLDARYPKMINESIKYHKRMDMKDKDSVLAVLYAVKDSLKTDGKLAKDLMSPPQDNDYPEAFLTLRRGFLNKHRLNLKVGMAGVAKVAKNGDVTLVLDPDTIKWYGEYATSDTEIFADSFMQVALRDDEYLKKRQPAFYKLLLKLID